MSRGERAGAALLASHQTFGHVQHHAIDGQRLERRAKGGVDRVREPWVHRDGLAHERQRPGPAAQHAHRFGEAGGLDVDDPVAEALGRAGAPVVSFVRIEDDHLTGSARTDGAAVVEDLDAAVGQADRVGVVTVLRVRRAREPRPEQLEPVNGPCAGDPTPDRLSARSFKTFAGRSGSLEHGGKGTPTEIAALFENLTTPHVADACLRRGVDVRCAPWDLRPLSPSTSSMAGGVRPVRHYGSVDIFLEALEHARPGDVLVVDNGGREDEACVGDLIALEAKIAGLAGIVIWGLHRDTPEILEIGLPLFSLGACPTGPLRLDPREANALDSARVGRWVVGANDVAMGDDNGVLFVPMARAEEIAVAACAIRDTERAQAERIRRGTALRAQLQFSDSLPGVCRIRG